MSKRVKQQEQAVVAEVVKSKSVVPTKYRQEYGSKGNNGDHIATLLKESDLAAVADANGIDLTRWAGKNVGMVRMNLGNVIRGRVRRGEKVMLGGQTIQIAPATEVAA